MNKLLRNSLLSFSALAMGATVSTPLLAAGTLANTDINNTATLNFTLGGTTQTPIESSPTGNTVPGVGSGTPTNFKVDRRINLTVVTTDTAPVNVALGNTAMSTHFKVTNITNDNIDVLLSTLANMPNGSIGATGVDTADFINNSCTTALASAPGTPITKLTAVAPDASVDVIVTCDIKTLAQTASTYAAMNEKINVVSLIGQAAIANGGAAYTQDTGADVQSTVQNVFGDEAGGAAALGGTGTTNGGAGDANDTYRDGKNSADSAYRIRMPILGVTKTETIVCDPLNGSTNPKHIPGAIVRYSVTVKNDATALASGTLSNVTDTLSANLTPDANFVTGATAATCLSPGGTPASAAGSGFRETNAAVSPATLTRQAGPLYLTNAVDTDGASIAGQVITLDYAKALPADVSHAIGELKPGESITIEFQAVIK